MKHRLTQESVGSLSWTGKEERIADDQQAGFYVRVTKESRTFVAQASVNGKTRGPVTLGRFEDNMPVDEARRLAALQIAAWRTGANVSMPAPGTATLKEAWEKYQKTTGTKGGKKITRTKSTIESYTRVLNLHTPKDWWAKPLSFITPQAVDARHSEIGKNSGHATADQWVRYVRAIYEKYDREHPQLNLPKNPCKAIDQFRPEARTEVVTWEELPAWWEAVGSCSPIRRDCWRMLLLTGLRSNACSELTWKEIDLDKGEITIPAERMKSGKEFTLPISRYVVDLLKGRKADNGRDFGGHDGGFVFPTTDRKGNVRAIRDISQQGYDGKGNKVRLLPGAQVLRRTFNSACLDTKVNIPEHHRFFLMNHAKPNGVNLKHYNGNMRGLDPYCESLERVTAEILKAVGVEYTTSKGGATSTAQVEELWETLPPDVRRKIAAMVHSGKVA